MRTLAVFSTLILWGVSANSQPHPTNPLEQLRFLVGEWQADLPGVGSLTSSIRIVSNGKAIEETIGTAADNEVSIYTSDEDQVRLTHFCALTPDGHQVQLKAVRRPGLHDSLEFAFAGATNLHSSAAPHMRRMVLTFIDHDHFSEQWTKTQDGKDTVFVLNFVRL